MINHNIRKALISIIPFFILLFLHFQFTEAVDQTDWNVTHFVIERRFPAGDVYFRFMTYLANEEFVWVTTIAIVLLIAVVWRKWRLALIYGLAVALGNLVLNPAIKEIFKRARPDETLRLVFADSYSFPSGHSFAAAMIYPLLGYLFIRHTSMVRDTKILRLLLIITVISIGFSRIYLGVHFLSDVIGGMSLGFAFHYLTRFVTDKYIER